MHTIHHTEAFVIRSEPSGEANKRLWLFTQEFGLLIVMVQGVRKPTAKLQGHISDYSVIAADLIKGKNSWRLVSAKVLEVPMRANARSALARAYVRTLSFLERFLTGEGAHSELFDHMRAMAAIIEQGGYDARAVDALSLWKMLVLLGYVAVSDDEQVLLMLPLGEAVAHVDETMIKKLIKQATDGITHSHL